MRLIRPYGAFTIAPRCWITCAASAAPRAAPASALAPMRRAVSQAALKESPAAVVSTGRAIRGGVTRHSPASAPSVPSPTNATRHVPAPFLITISAPPRACSRHAFFGRGIAEKRTLIIETGKNEGCRRRAACYLAPCHVFIRPQTGAVVAVKADYGAARPGAGQHREQSVAACRAEDRQCNAADIEQVEIRQ